MNNKSSVIKEFTYVQRKCCVCGVDNSEDIWQYEHKTRTRSYYWIFEVNNVVCKKCGFVYVTPVPVTRELEGYYGDSLVTYENQILDYDIDKRLQLINKYKRNFSTFMELGSNAKSDFSKQIKSMFNKVITVEPNHAHESDYENICDVPSNSINMLTNYFVLEHISNIDEIFNEFKRVVSNNGILICEIPDIRMYPDNITACHQHEHLNHFSPPLLARVAEKYGFIEINSSVNECSRNYGFVSVFEKLDVNDTVSIDKNEYVNNIKYFEDGKNKAISILDEFERARQKLIMLVENNTPYILWGANDNLLQFKDALSIDSGLVCVDSDPNKKDYLPGIAIYTPDKANEIINNSEYIFIFAGRHKNGILNFIQSNYNKKYDENRIYILDREK